MRRPFRILRALVILVVLVIAVVAAIGLALPRAHEATRSARIDAPPMAIYSVLITPETYPQWRPDVASVDRLDSDRFREHGEGGPMVFRIVSRQPPSRAVVALDDPDQPFSGTWTIELTPEGEGTRVRITERGEVPNPIFRAIARAMMLPTDSIELYLTNLGRRFNTAVVIEP